MMAFSSIQTQVPLVPAQKQLRSRDETSQYDFVITWNFHVDIILRKQNIEKKLKFTMATVLNGVYKYDWIYVTFFALISK